jgi:SsrA-binding protein
MSVKKPKKNLSPTIENRRARHEYYFVQEYEAGIVLTGTEVKSVREGKVNMGDSFCYITSKGEMYVKNMHISEYKFGTYNNHNPLSIRKLLLNKQELKKIGQKTKEKGFTIVPVKLYFTERGFIKLHIALAQGKKSYDKRDSMKERDSKRDLDRVKKEYK